MSAPKSRPTVRTTARGWRLSQHGTVLSEMLRRPGPTHSVFDVLAAACVIRPKVERVAVLGFGGGSTVAALRALSCHASIHAADLDPTGWEMLQRSRAEWLQPLSWHHEDAASWLRQAGSFDAILDDLSVPVAGEVEKPAITWNSLPRLVSRHLRPGGLAIFNLLRPRHLGWPAGLARIRSFFGASCVVSLDAFENRIVLAEKRSSQPDGLLGSPRLVGNAIRQQLRCLGSRQADRIQVRALPRIVGP